ncbi:MAG: tetratricopeptide repeat protein [Acidobacteriota bacterium]
MDERRKQDLEKLLANGDNNTDIPSVPTSSHQLPSRPVDFIGREAEIRELLAKIQDGGVTISGLRGMGGIGKTALALVLADKLHKQYPYQLLIDLQGAAEQQSLSSAQAMQKIITDIDPQIKPPDDVEQLKRVYCSLLSDKVSNGLPVLLLLDNARDAEQVKPLIPPRGCVAIVTSRQYFSLQGWYVKNLDVLPADDARDLLIKVASEMSIDIANQICSMCGYLPLAICAAGSQIAGTPDLLPVKYATRLKDERRRFQAIGKEKKELGVELDLEACFNLSYRGLSEDSARVFRMLAVFPYSFDSEAEEMVCEDEEHRCLSELVRRSLVLFDQVSERYRLHDLVRLFADAKLGDDERYKVQERHSAHYCGVLNYATDLYEKGNDNVLAGLKLFDTERVNIETGQKWAVENAEKDERVAGLCDDYPYVGSYVLSLRLHPRERIGWLEAALSATRKMGWKNSEGEHLGCLGLAYWSLGEYRKAIEYHEQSLTTAREIGDRKGEGNALCNLGNAYAALGDTHKAISYCYNLYNLAETLNTLGKLSQAIACAEESLKISELIEDPYAEETRRFLARLRSQQ